VLSSRFDNSAVAEGAEGHVVEDVADVVVDAFRRLLLRLPSARPQKGRQALRDVIGDEGWAGADDDYDRAVSFSPAAFTWKRALRNLVELPALWTSIPLLGRDPRELWAQARAILAEQGCALPPFVVAHDVALTLVWAIEPLRRPREGKPAYHFECFFEQLQCWRFAAMKLSYALEPLGAVVLDPAAADEALLGFLPLPLRRADGLARHAADLGLVPAVVVVDDMPPPPTTVRIAAVSRPLRRFDARLFAALGRTAVPGARRRWRASDVSQAARAPQTAGARHPAALKLVCANRWDGLSREANLADLRAWAATCENDGAFPTRAGADGVDELEALVDWAENTLVPGGPTPRGDAERRRRPRRRTSRDHVAAAVCGFLADVGGAFEGSLVDLGRRAALWALDHGTTQPVPLRTLKRAVVDLVALGELGHDVVRVGPTWRSSFVLRASSSSSSSSSPRALTAVLPEKNALFCEASIPEAQGQQAKSMWAPGPVSSGAGWTFRGGSGGAFPLQGGSGGESPVTCSMAQPEHDPGLSSPAAREGQSSGIVAAAEGATGDDAAPAPVSSSSLLSSSSSRQRRLAFPRGRRPSRFATGRGPGADLPPLDDAVISALADVGRSLSGTDHRALLEEARAGLWARPRVLADFVGALRRRALRILRLREIAAASAAHLQARRHAEQRAQERAQERAAAQSPAVPSAVVADHDADAVVADFRRMLAAQVKPPHERDPVDRARRLYAEGLSLLPLPARSKKPASAWKQQQQQRLTLRRLEQELESFGSEAGLAVVCGEVSGVVVADFDDADAVAWARQHLPDTPWKTRTARGEHWYYRVPSSLTGAPFVPPPALPWKGELRTAGHYVVAPGSWHPEGVRYVALGDWSVAREALPVWSPAFVSSSSSSSSLAEIERLRAEREKILKS
jgi:hypothetical protein